MQNSTLEKFIKRISQPLYDNGAVNIVCLGDSVTQGCFGPDEIKPEQGYVSKFAGMLHFLFPNQVFNVINSGIGGTTAAYATERFERDVLNCSNYTGKGCFRIREFTERVGNLFEDNTILSHDFIEGAFAKTVVTNYDVFEECPDSYSRF